MLPVSRDLIVNALVIYISFLNVCFLAVSLVPVILQLLSSLSKQNFALNLLIDGYVFCTAVI